MGRIKLGRTGLVVEKQGFGCLPIQRMSNEEAVGQLHPLRVGSQGVGQSAEALVIHH